MAMNKAIIVITCMYAIISLMSLVVWPLPRLAAGSVSPLDAKWQRAGFVVIYGRMGLCCIAILLLLVLPGRLIWISMLLLLIGHIVQKGFIRAALRHAKNQQVRASLPASKELA